MRHRRRKDPLTTQRARQLRRDQTSAEAILWWRLRRNELGHRFRRQEPIGPYFVDFVCRRQGLVIEVDGATHEDVLRDRLRDAELERLGFRVLRFWNSEIYENLEGVLETIWLALQSEDLSP